MCEFPLNVYEFELLSYLLPLKTWLSLLNREIITTEDGSHSIMVHDINEAFHSDRGSWQESQYTFIERGLKQFIQENEQERNIKVFEMGLGTGLNALQSWMEAEISGVSIEYHGLEAFPLRPEEYSALNFNDFMDTSDFEDGLRNIHKAPWNEVVSLSPQFSIKKIAAKMEDAELDNEFDVVFFDAFSPKTQPELWSASIFQKLFKAMSYGGILVSYSAAGVFKRSLQASGFWMEEMRGARGKREMVRARKM